MALLEVKNLEKSFSGTKVLKNAQFTLDRGQVLAIIGSSGSGKTTLLRCLNSLETPDSGDIVVDGCSLLREENSQKENRGQFGLVFQNFNLFPQYTALQNVMLAPNLRNPREKAQNRRQAVALLEQVGLGEKQDAYPYQLSGGQQQRVAIARALAMKPKILCFDEPTSALDPELTGEVLRVIKDLKNENTTMIVVTHEMAFAKSVADVVIYMADGEIVETGSPEEVFENPKMEKTRAFIQGANETY